METDGTSARTAPRFDGLTAALGYAARGIPIFPLAPREKNPLTEHGFYDASTDAGRIRAWWKRWSQANIGVPTGKASGWVVLDMDARHGASIEDLEARFGPLPDTRFAQTGGGGWHFVFRHPGGIVAGGKLDGHRYEIKADGGYIVVAPSVHPSGGVYAWQNNSAPATIPTWLTLKLAEMEPDRERPARTGAEIPGTDDGAKWLRHFLTKSGAGVGDYCGYLLAQQLLIHDVPNLECVLLDYAERATLNPADPFDERSVRKWLDSAGRSDLVRRKERAKARDAAPAKPLHLPVPPTPIRRESAPDFTDKDYQESLPEPAALERKGGGGPSDPSALLQGGPDDNGNAVAMFHLYGRELLYTPAYGWLHWTGTHWSAIPEPIVFQFAIKTLKQRRHAAVESGNEPIIKITSVSRDHVSSCVTLFKSYVIEPDVSVFDADPDSLNCENGVLNLQTGALTPHKSSQRFTYCLPVPWDASADIEPWEAFQLEAQGHDAEAVAYFQVCVGYSLTGHTREEKMLYLHGPTRAGKGTTTETILELLPKPLSAEVDFATFTAKRENDSQNFDLAELKPARLVVASESNRHQTLNPAKIKMLTGGNWVRCAFKHKDMFSYRPQFKVWLVSNFEANADPDDDAAWGRVQVFTFPHSHLGSEDTTLKARMKSPENLRGVLRWAVEGAMRWYEQGRLMPPSSITNATQAHRDAQDFIKQWIDDTCTLDAEQWTAMAGLTQSYQAWCKLNNVEPRSANDFAATLVKRFQCTPKRKHGGVRGYKGIGFRVTPQTPNDE